MTTSDESYRHHLECLDTWLGESLDLAARAGASYEGVAFHSGRPLIYHADDHEAVFWPTPHARRWVPPLEGPDHLVLARPGRRPLVVRVRPQDYWYDTSPPPLSHWEEAVDLVEVSELKQALQATGELVRVAYVGNSPAAAAELGIAAEAVEPPALMAPLDWFRAYKTGYEVAAIRRAAERTARGHLAARDAFLAGGSERRIHQAYVQATGQLESELPFATIAALDAKAAILHYQHKRGEEAAPGRVLLMDAGAASDGYAADVTRTWTRPGTEASFVRLVEGLDAIERHLVGMVTPGRPFAEIHIEAHRRIAELLGEVGLLRVGPEEAVERQLTRAFMPHGVGHHLGIQVHDVGGHMAGPHGGTVPPPEGHPHLRNNRILEPGHVVTVEPGIYFIEMLLAPLRHGEGAGAVDWGLVDRLAPLGGVRVEDDVLCTPAGAVDLTRWLLPGPRS